MIKLDKATLLSPFPIIYKNITIYKPTLQEIFQTFGFSNYNRATNLLTISDIEIGDYYKKNKLPMGEIEPYLWLIQNAQADKTFLLELSLAFFTYLKKPVIIKDNCFCFKNEESELITLTREDFPDFQKIIRAINCEDISSEEDEREIITDDLRMKQLFMEKRKKLRQAKERAKKKQIEEGNQIELSDMISALCIYNAGYTLLNVWNLTVYQLYNQFNKCQLKDSFDKDYSALLAGADKNKIKIKNWIKD